MRTDTRNNGDKWADRVAGAVGSWRFIAIQSTMIAAWITLNSLWLTSTLHFDRFPFVLLNLGFSLQAAYAAPILQMSNNRRGALAKEHNDQLLNAILANMQAMHAIVLATRTELEEHFEPDE